MKRRKLLLTAALVGASAVAMQARAASIIYQENFTSADFYTQYKNVTGGGSGASVPEGTYALENNPSDSHSLWINQTLPSTFMVVNGATSSGPLTVWEKDGLTTVPGQTYSFSFNVVDVCCNSGYSQSNNSPFNLEFNVNTGSGFNTVKTYASTPPGDVGTIYTITGTFTGGSTLGLQILDTATAPGGNDFAIGNITVSSVPEPATWAMLILGVAMIGFTARRRSEGMSLAA